MTAANPCPRLRRALAQSRRPFIVHHWDADGVASAALAWRNWAEPAATAVPSIGSYTWRAVPVPPPGADAVAVLDYGIPGPEYEELEKREDKPLIVVDHHRVPPAGLSRGAYCNPAATRGEDWASASLLLHRVLDAPPRGVDAELAALGAVGDLQPFLDAGKPHPGLEEAKHLAASAGIGLEELREAAIRVDSCYRLLDESCLRHAVRVAAEAGARGILGDERLREARIRADRLLDEALHLLQGPERPVPGVLLYRLDMDAYVTSALGRRLAAENPESVTVLLHRLPRSSRGFIYARSLSRSLAPVLQMLRARGLRVGGKEHVVVLEFQGDPGPVLMALLEALQGSGT